VKWNGPWLGAQSRKKRIAKNLLSGLLN